jgi:mannose-6-phosphate isomerase-like protein (cupin superfamily)
MITFLHAAKRRVTSISPMIDHFRLDRAFASFSEHWRPRLVANLNGQELKAVKVQGVFPWHHHDDVDELFLVWKGTITIETQTSATHLAAGDGLVIPRGVGHRVIAESEAEVLLLEPAGVVNTGNVRDAEFTASSTPPVEDK